MLRDGDHGFALLKAATTDMEVSAASAVATAPECRIAFTNRQAVALPETDTALARAPDPRRLESIFFH
jgi:hypothetical protein